MRRWNIHIAAMAGVISVLAALPGGSSCVGQQASQPAAFAIDAGFPGGNIIVDRIESDRVFLRQDRRDTPRWWFYWYFRVRGAGGRTLGFHFTDENVIGVRGPAVSADGGRTWGWLGAEAVQKASFRYSFPAGANDVRFSFTIPYLESDLREFLKSYGGHSHLRAATLCKTNKGRDAECLYLGRIDGEAPQRVLLTARHHACESMAGFALEGLMRTVLDEGEDGKWLRENVEFLVIPFVDKDGVEDGDQGKARAPHDHNRDYQDPSIYPTVRAIRRQVPAWAGGKLRLALDLHCPYIRGGRNEVIFFVGMENERMKVQLDRFSSLLESLQTAGLGYRAENNLPFGKEWNVPKSYADGASFHYWAGGLPGVDLATTIEIPYANASGAAVTPDSARAFGRDLARAIRRFLDR